MKLNVIPEIFTRFIPVLWTSLLDLFSRSLILYFTHTASSLKNQLLTAEARISQRINVSGFIYSAHPLGKEVFISNPIMFLCA